MSLESGSSDYVCAENSLIFPNVSFDSNIFVEIDYKSKSIHTPDGKAMRKKDNASERSEFFSEPCRGLERLDISIDSNNSIELFDFTKENGVQNPGKFKFHHEYFQHCS